MTKAEDILRTALTDVRWETMSEYNRTLRAHNGDLENPDVVSLATKIDALENIRKLWGYQHSKIPKR